jgi:hypothetical protein
MKKSIPKFSRSRLHPRVILSSLPRNIAVRGIKIQAMFASQLRDKLLIRVGLRPTQPVIEMNNRENHAQFLTQFNEQAKQRNRINPARNRDPDPVSGTQKVLPPNMG